jgi:hypothetical protein
MASLAGEAFAARLRRRIVLERPVAGISAADEQQYTYGAQHNMHEPSRNHFSLLILPNQPSFSVISNGRNTSSLRKN